jgi:hypothetical protein
MRDEGDATGLYTELICFETIFCSTYVDSFTVYEAFPYRGAIDQWIYVTQNYFWKSIKSPL